jgi:hypothetical protein
VQQPQSQPQQQPQRPPQQQQQSQPPQVSGLRQNINNTTNNVSAAVPVNKVDSVSKFTELPKPKRKQKSDKNTVSLDI